MRPPCSWSLLWVLMVLAVAPQGAARAEADPQVRAALERLLADGGTDAGWAARRYRERLQSSGVFVADAPGALWESAGPRVGPRNTLVLRADAHAGVAGYALRKCESCHEDAAGNLHHERGNLTCRQCHGGDPVASVAHYHSPLNPIRRHAYVCAKCHEQASRSFASYVVHPPRPGSAAAREEFPALYWSHVAMLGLILGVFAVLLPHSILWWFREWLVQRRKEN